MINYNFSDMVITGISRVLSVHLHPDRHKDMNDRVTDGLIIAINGTLIYKHNGVEYISDPTHVLLLSRGISYSFESKTESDSVVINFNAENFPFAGIECLEMDLKNMAHRLDNYWSFQKESYKLKCFEELYAFFTRINHTEEYVPNSMRSLIAPSITYLEKHYTNPELSNEELAAVSGLSTVYFRKLFKKYYKMAPMKYIRMKRIDKAKSTLESDYCVSITSVAETCGFNSVYYFSKVFKEETSYTPSEYIALHKKQ